MIFSHIFHTICLAFSQVPQYFQLGCANKKTKYHILTFLVILVDPDYAQD